MTMLQKYDRLPRRKSNASVFSLRREASSETEHKESGEIRIPHVSERPLWRSGDWRPAADCRLQRRGRPSFRNEIHPGEPFGEFGWPCAIGGSASVIQSTAIGTPLKCLVFYLPEEASVEVLTKEESHGCWTASGEPWNKQ